MKLVLLGTGGYFPTSQRQTACLLLPDVGVVLDAGTGMSYLGIYRRTDRLDIFLTHAHLDHIAGLTYLVRILPPTVAAQTTVHGDAAKLRAIREHLFAAEIFPVEPTFKFAPLSSPVGVAGDGTLTHFSLQHPGGSLGYRLDWPGHSLAYVTDTTAAVDADYIEQICGVDLLVHEANFPANIEDKPALTGHSWLAAVAQVAANARVGKLVLVHIDPLLDQGEYDLTAARKIFAHIELAADRMELEF
jgi:ribonuclease BN (tRNA processing enzyme)